MLTRLFQRAGTIGAASVALFVSLIAPVHASTAAQVNVYGVDTVRNADGAFEARYHFQRRFAANDPVNPGKVDYVTRRIKVEKRGNPMKWIKRNPLEVAAALAAASAGYVIDDLTGQVMGTVPVTVHDAFNDPYASSGGEWCLSGYSGCYGATYDPISATIAGPYSTYHSHYFQSPDSLVVKYNKSGYLLDRRYLRNTSSVPLSELPPSTVPLPDSEVWDILNPVADAAPESHLLPWVKDANGNPYIYPEVQAEQAKIAQGVPGAEALPDAVVVNDPLEGQGLDPSGMPTGEPIPTPEAPPSETAPLEWPTDYAREGTLSEQKNAVIDLRDFFKEEFNTEPDITQDNPADQIYQPLTDQFDTLPDLPGGIPAVGDFGISSGSCQSISLSWRGHSVEFPNGSQCAKLNSAKQILGWFIYVCTFFGCIYTVLGARSLRA